jgi:Flp pilus assembly protein TadG
VRSNSNSHHPLSRFKSYWRAGVAKVRDRRGAVAVFFALSLAVLAPLTLGVMDVYSASSQRIELQDALDAATLSAARSTGTTTAAVDAVGDKSLNSNLVLPSGASLLASNFTLSDATVTGYAEITPTAIAPGLWPHGTIKANASVVRAVDRLEIALVLDNTGSMSGVKLATLKTAGKNLMDTLAAAAARSTDPTPLRVSLVPFSMTVRVQGTTPTTSYNTVTHTGAGIPAWIDPQGTAHAAAGVAFDTFNAKTDRFTMLKQMAAQPWEGCVEARRQPYDIQETAPTSVTPATMFVPFFWPDEPDSSAGFNGYPNNYLNDVSASASWKVREQYAAKYTAAPRSGTQSGTGYNLGPNAGCTLQPIIRLTTNTASIKTAIDSMVAVGDTNIPLGMMWGWHSLTPFAPLADGTAYNTPHVRKIIILMTDGDNTMGDPSSSSEQNKSYYSGLGYIWQGILGITSGTSSQRTSAMNARLTALCTNIKAKDIVIYTVRVEVTSGSSTVLQNCASSADKFYDVQDVSQLGAAFDAIAGSIDNLRIAS